MWGILLCWVLSTLYNYGILYAIYSDKDVFADEAKTGSSNFRAA